MISDHIKDYNVDLSQLKKGDIIVKEFQYGIRPNGGTKGFIPVEVVEVFDGDSITVNNGEYDFQIWYDELCDWEKFHKLDKNVFKWG